MRHRATHGTEFAWCPKESTYMTRYVVLVLLAGLAGSAAAVSAQRGPSAEAGRDVYESRECDRCHMIAGRGYRHGKLDGVASKLSADEMRRWLRSPADMEAALETKPKVKMSSRKRMQLTDAEVEALVVYLRTLR
jgi:mono/diheme cytochrome c family protein